MLAMPFVETRLRRGAEVRMSRLHLGDHDRRRSCAPLGRRLESGQRGDDGAIRIVLPMEELDPARIGAVPVRNGVPLSAIVRVRAAPRELERVGGKPVVAVWLRSETAECELRDLLPNADVTTRQLESW
jgi:hypothetical protein